MRGNSTISNRCRCHRTAAVDHRTSCRWRPPYAEAVKFPEENMIFITHNGFLYYIYNPKFIYWQKHRDAGNDYITVQNYPDVSRQELEDAMHGRFPNRETDFMRLCNPAQLCIRDMLSLLKEDYGKYMSEHAIYHTIHCFLLESDICHKSYEEVKKLLDTATELHYDVQNLLCAIKDLCFRIIGRDIFKKEIRIVDGHDGSSYFWIMPVRVIDYTNSDGLDNVAEMSCVEISIEEDDVAQYLTPFLYAHFDENLDANKNRHDARGFEWYLTHNFFSLQSMTKVVEDIKSTIDALINGKETEYTTKLKVKRGMATYQLIYAKDLSEDQIKAYNANRPTEDNTEVDLLIDFYQRFIYRMEYMMRVGREKGYDLISFMGP